MIAIQNKFPDVTAEEELKATKLLISRLPEQPVNWQAILFREFKGEVPIITTIEDFRFVLRAQLNRLRDLAQDMRDIGWTLIGSDHTRYLKEKPIRKRPVPNSSIPSGEQPLQKKSSKIILDPTCTGCGRNNHTVEFCHFKGSPYYNSSNELYSKSEAFVKLRRDFPTTILAPSVKFLAENAAKVAEKATSSSSLKLTKTKQKGSFFPDSTYFATISGPECDTDYLSVAVSHVSQSLEPPRSEIKALLDTGSLAGDFIAYRCILNLKLDSFILTSKKRIVCSGLDNKCYDISKSVDLRIFYFCETLNKTVFIEITAIILESSPVDLILGRKTIKRHKLFDQIPSQLSVQNVDSASRALTGILPEKVVKPCDCIPGGNLQPSPGTKTENSKTKLNNQAVSYTPGLLASLVSKSEFISAIATSADDDIDSHESDTFAPYLPSDSKIDDPLASLHISGDDDLQRRLRLLCEEFRDLFTTELPITPANIPPFHLVVDDSQWEHNRNRGPPRPQTTSNNADIVRQIAILEKQGIIEKSTAVYYSQVLMVPKPDGSRRLCVDYRPLNKCTPNPSWPLHEIKESFNRIGAQKPKIFGLMDFTQGFHQAPLTLTTRVYTAFIVFCGIYQFTRLPFGLKGAPSYFQQTIATVVLAGLLYFTCEVYIDDVNVYAKDNDEFLTRLREVFQRFRHHRVYLKASKCFLGYSELNYLGKVISSEGLQMSKDRVKQVVDFPTPQLSKQLKSFLGITNYFRDHVRNHSMVVKPLHSLLTNYCKTKKITWTAEALNAFQQIKKEILKCTTMHFINDTDPIYLHTDASDFGIGGYLFQLTDGKEVPVAFVSKSLTTVQLKWAVIQKEAYAIYYCCIFLKTLLRDRVFTIRTDHKNLLFLHENSNPMITRWFMALSQYSYEIEFISGIDNGIADSMSRLCRNNMTDLPHVYTTSEVLCSNIIEKFKLTPFQYKTISSLHNSTVGHFGLDRTMKRLNDINQKWEFQRQHVRWFIDHCPCCQKMSMLKIPLHAHGFTTSTYTPMECLNVDFVGPFPDGGYIFVIIDTFTRWVELFHTIDATAFSAAKCLFQHFGRFGAPYQLRSDNGPHFVADLITEFLSLVGVQHCLTLAYSKEENAIVERMNKEINRHLRALTYDNLSLDNYKDSLPFVQRILNSNHSDRLKISAADLLFGKVLSLDRGIFLPKTEHPTTSKTLSIHASKMLKMQDNLLKASAKELLRTDLLHQASKDTFEHKEFLPNSYVLVHHRSGAPPTRLHTFWRGPMRVISGNNSRYKLYDLITHKEHTFHTSDMKPFLFDSAITDPLDVARRDHMEFFVEQILDHRGDIKRRTTLEFYVKWLNYPDNENSWTPYSHLRDTDKLHEYLRSKNMQRLIPKKFL